LFVTYKIIKIIIICLFHRVKAWKLLKHAVKQNI